MIRWIRNAKYFFFRLWLLLTLTCGSVPSHGAEFVINRVFENGFYRGAPVAACYFGNERIAVFGNSNIRPGYVVVQEGGRRTDVVPSHGDWVAIKCPESQRPDALAVSPSGVLRSRNGTLWESFFKLEKGKITAAAFFRDTIFLATDQGRLLIWENNHWLSVPIYIKGKPRRLYFSSRRKGVLWVDSPQGGVFGYWTTDGGTTWSPATVTVPKEAVVSRFDSTGVGFFDEDRGVSIGTYVIGRKIVGSLMTTDNGGRTWRPIVGNIDPLEMQIKKIVSLDPEHLLVVSNLALYIMEVGSDQLVKLKIQGKELERNLLETRYQGTSASKQDGNVLIVAEDSQLYVLVGGVR